MFYKGKQRHNPHSNARPLTPEQVERALGGSVLVKPKPPLSAGALEAQQIIEKAKQLKGEAMPDLNTALRTAMQQWEQDEKETQLEKPVATGKQNLFEITNNVTRATYNYVRDNPNCSYAEIKRALSTYNTGSVASLLTQFVYQEQMVRSEDNRYTVINKEYRPLVARQKWDKDHGIVTSVKPKKLIVKRKQHAQAAGISALAVKEKKQEITSILISRGWTAQGVVDKLTVMQARQLYDLLKQIFGG